MYTRPMRIDEFSVEKMIAFEEMAKHVAERRHEIVHDPEGCFGGRGNNIGSVILAEAEAELAKMQVAGYSKASRTFKALIDAGIRFEAVTGVGIRERDGKICITAIPGRGRKITGQDIEANWYLEDAPEDIQTEAKAILRIAKAGFKLPRVEA